MKDLKAGMAELYPRNEEQGEGATPAGAGCNCVRVQAELLAVEPGMPQEGGKRPAAVAPGVGDAVEIVATGKVTAVEGGIATISIETVNGAPVKSGAKDEEVERVGEDARFDDNGAAGKALRARAKSYDDAGSGDDWG